MARTARVFRRFLNVKMPEKLTANAKGQSPPFEIELVADGLIPFPQIVFYQPTGNKKIIGGDLISLKHRSAHRAVYVANVPAGVVDQGRASVRIEGCRVAEIDRAAASDWIKEELKSLEVRNFEGDATLVLAVPGRKEEDLMQSAKDDTNAVADPSERGAEGANIAGPQLSSGGYGELRESPRMIDEVDDAPEISESDLDEVLHSRPDLARELVRQHLKTQYGRDSVKRLTRERSPLTARQEAVQCIHPGVQDENLDFTKRSKRLGVSKAFPTEPGRYEFEHQQRDWATRRR